MAFHHSTGFTQDPLPRFTQRLKILGITQNSFSEEWSNNIQKALTFAIADANCNISGKDWIEQIQRWQSITKNKLGNFDCIGLSTCLNDFAKINLRPSDPWLQHWYSATAKKFSTFEPQSFSNSLYALAKLGIAPPEDWLRNWQIASCKKLDHFNNQDVCHCLYALSVFHILGADVRDIAEQFNRALLSRLTLQTTGLSSINAHQYYLACKVFEWPISQNIMNSSKERNLSIGSSRSEVRVASALNTIRNQLAKMRGLHITSIDREAVHPETLSPVDFKIAINHENGKKSIIYLEIDGTTHFIDDAKKQHHESSSTLIRNHLMQNYAKKTHTGFAVITMRLNEFDRDALIKIVKSALSSAFHHPEASPPSVSSNPDTKATSLARHGTVKAASTLEPRARWHT